MKKKQTKKAVIEIGGHQYLASKDDIIKVGRIKKGEKPAKNILLYSDDQKTEIGYPYLNRKVELRVLESGQEKKKRIVKFKPKKNYRKIIGYHPTYTKIKITKI